MRLGDLRGIHFAGYLIAPALGRVAAAHRREIEPFVRRDKILSYALAGRIGQSEIVERLGAARPGFTLLLRQ